MSEQDDAAVEFLEQRKRDYQLCFGSPAGQRVLMDLSTFCRAAETCVVPGDRDKTYVLEGRRETWLRIQQHINMTPEQLFHIFVGRPYITGESDDA